MTAKNFVNKRISMEQLLELMRNDAQALREQASENEVDIIDLRTRLARVEKKVGLS